MPSDLDQIDVGRLERSCSGQVDRIRLFPGDDGIERAEAVFHGPAFAPHRHDRYAIGLTLWGVQSFFYRGMRRFSQSGQLVVLHPDEIHDGAPGTSAGFGYRILYIDPDLIQRSLGGCLPFVKSPVLEHPALARTLVPLFRDFADPLDNLATAESVSVLADALACAADLKSTQGPVDRNAVSRARQFLLDNLTGRVALADLEREAGIDRWRLTRQFRRVYGTSPYRFFTMRRLERARQLLLQAVPLAEAAFMAGFADQSHLTRQFKRCYGLSPGAWFTMVASASYNPNRDR